MAKHGDPRTDSAGRELFALSQEAYEKCLALLPDDPLWHFGYAELLWSHYYFDLYTNGKSDEQGLFPRILNELKTSLDLDPNNQRAKDLLSWISSSIPNSVIITDVGYEFLGLTATPEPPKPFLFVTETPIPSPTVAVTASPTPLANTPTALPTKPSAPSRAPICGGIGLALPVVAGLLWFSRRRVM
jgi:tetratricopeptide (TPR) repeat protein